MEGTVIAPVATYILFSMTATVGSILVAMLPILFPRRPAEPAIPEQELIGDRRTLHYRRLVFLGFGTLLTVTWLPMTVFLLANWTKWGAIHYVHFIGLVAILCMFVWGMSALVDRLTATSATSLHPAVGGESGPPQ